MVLPTTAPSAHVIGTGAGLIRRHRPVLASKSAPSLSAGCSGRAHSAAGGHGSASLPPTTSTRSPTPTAIAGSRGLSGPAGSSLHDSVDGVVDSGPLHAVATSAVIARAASWIRAMPVGHPRIARGSNRIPKHALASALAPAPAQGATYPTM